MLERLSRKITYKGCLLAYIVFFSVLTVPFWWGGEVVAPYRQFSELAIPDSTGSIEIENRKFSDFVNGYIPEISEHLHGIRSGWLMLWTDKTELGRPIYQISGFSPAYFPLWVLVNFTDSPWRFITTLSLFTCFVSGVFIILFSRELRLHPVAALVGGVSLATSPLFMYWLTFPMFPATWCWASGALWAVTRISRKIDLTGFFSLAFCIYSLGMTGYPQPIIFNAYIILLYSLTLAYGKYKVSFDALCKFLTVSVFALIVGGALTLPVYIDLANVALESNRIAPEPSFFTIYLLKLHSLDDAFRFLLLSIAPEFFGNPISSDYPLTYDGLSITPLLLFFSLICLFSGFKKTFGWWIAVFVFLILTFNIYLYEFCAKYLGFNLSPSIPLGGAMLPLTLIATIGANELITCKNVKRRCVLVVGPMLIACSLIAISLIWGFSNKFDLRWCIVILTLFALGLLLAQIDKSRPWLIVLALAIITAAFSSPLMLRQSPESIARSSPLVEFIRNELSERGGRFAIVDSDIKVLPPNLNTTLALASIHSYNSLSSLRYQKFITELGGETKVLGRLNSSISPNFNGSVFWMSNITLILASQRLNEPSLDFLREISGVYLHRVKYSIGNGVQVLSSSVEGGHGTFSIDNPRDKVIYSPVKKVDQGDLIDFDLAPIDSTSLLILSQKYHGDWQAKVLTETAWITAEAVEVNGIFQGVLLPPKSRSVRLEFKPYVRFAWIGHVFWLAILALMAFRMWKIKHRIFVL